MPHPSLADAIEVPLDVQAKLVARVLSYDRNFRERAGDRVHIVVLIRPAIAESKRAATELERLLRDLGNIDGLPLDVKVEPYEGADALKTECSRQRVALVYVTPGFDPDVPTMARALDGTDVLTVATTAGAVYAGLVLGFELVSGKPKMLIHLAQARRQNVALMATVLYLMKVVG